MSMAGSHPSSVSRLTQAALAGAVIKLRPYANPRSIEAFARGRDEDDANG